MRRQRPNRSSRRSLTGIPRGLTSRGGKCGAAAALSFSPYPVDAVLVLYPTDAGRPAIAFEARTQRGMCFPIAGEALLQGHFVYEATWYPVSTPDSEAIARLLTKAGLGAASPVPSTLSQCLELKKAAAAGGPVVDRLPDEALMNLATILGDGPSGIAGTLYPYQIDGWRWLCFIMREHAGGVLADEMGLGKTLQIISALRDSGQAAGWRVVTGGGSWFAVGELGSRDRQVLPQLRGAQAPRRRPHR